MKPICPDIVLNYTKFIVAFMLTHHARKIISLVLFCLILLILGFVFLYPRFEGKPVLPLLPERRSELPHPAQILDLTSWKLTLPTTAPGTPNLPLEIRQPQLATFQQQPWFTSIPDKTGVVFRAPVSAPTTANSNYPRTELREMSNDGLDNLFWPSISGVHSLFIEQAITAVPANKASVVAGQIHGDDDDLIVIRLDYPLLYVARGGSNLYTLDSNYTLGKRFTIKFIASDGKIKVYYNASADPVYTLEKKVQQAYFKAGVYAQSNCETEGALEFCSADNYGEVIIYQLRVTHQQ